MIQKCPYIPWCISRTSFPEKHIKATGWTILLSRMKTCVDFTCGKTRRIAMSCVYVYIFMIIHLLSLSWSCWREKRAYRTIRGACTFSHAPPSSSPRRFFTFESKRGPSHKICATFFAQLFFSFPLPFFCFFEKAGNALHFVVFSVFPGITTT